MVNYITKLPFETKDFASAERIASNNITNFMLTNQLLV